MNDTAKRRLRLKEIHNNTYDTDEVLELLKGFEGTDHYGGAEAFVCALLNIRPENIWSLFEYV